MKQYKIVSITQIHNEIRKGHLERFFQFLPKVVDEIVVYDDASSDGSWEYSLKFTPHVIRGAKNDFTNEWQHKQTLLKKAISLGADFILSIDADEVVSDENGTKLQKLANWLINKGLDGAYLRDINLWRSVSWARTDNDFDKANFLRFWKVKPDMNYVNRNSGLHQSPAPDSIKKVESQNIVSLLHFGFATDKSIIAKYLTYAKHGQKGINLSRLIDERELALRPIEKSLFPAGLYEDSSKPEARSIIGWLKLADQLKPELLRPAISIVALIYKSTDWLKFCYEQVIKHTDMSDKEFYFVANDATEDVKAYLKNNYIPHYIFENSEEHKKEWYINNVYRAWNYAGKMAKGDYVLFINSDMAFSPNWVEKIFARLDGKNCVCSRLVESGKLGSGGLNIEKDFGKLIEEYNEQAFQEYVNSIIEDKLENGGAFMPLLIKKDDFLAVNGYPEGNVVKGSNIYYPKIAKQGEELVSGDVVLMDKLNDRGVKHQTAFDSIVYHFQEGEMTSLTEGSNAFVNPEILIVNNSLQGLMDEKVMWNFMLDGLPRSAGIDIARVEGNESNFEIKARQFIEKNLPNVKIIIQNASYIEFLLPKIPTVAFLQDNLRSMGKVSFEQEANLEMADHLVANTFDTASSYPEYNFDIIPVGVDKNLFRILDKTSLREKYQIYTQKVGIFVGDLNDVKGWGEVKTVIESCNEITFIVVSKSDKKYQADNVRMYNKISQKILAELYNCADFFILGSKVETQCLAAMEACFCDVPVIMRPIGIFTNMSEQERNLCGIFSADFKESIDQVYKIKFSPRAVMERLGMDVDTMISAWWNLIAKVKLQKYIFNSNKKQQNFKLTNIFKKFLMVLGNKNYINVYLRKKLPSGLYYKLLDIWRFTKNLKRSILK